MIRPTHPCSSGECQITRFTISAQVFSPGQGGIARVARLTLKALESDFDVRGLAVEDRHSCLVSKTRTRPFSGNRWRFLLANNFEILSGRKIFYDFAGTARAHQPGLGGFKTRYGVWIHGVEVWNLPTVRRRAAYARTVRGADLILANSHYTLKRAQEALGPLPQAAVCWLGTEDDDEICSIDLTKKEPTLMFVGRSDDLAKGQDILINIWSDVVSEVPNARLVFVGGGIQLKKLQELAGVSPAADKIEVLGFVSDAQIEAIWRRATAFAMLGSLEGFGLVFVEAMRYGLPIIASTNDASHEINVDGLTGWNVARTDRNEIIEKIALVLKDRDQASAFGRAALNRWRGHFRFSVFEKRFKAAVFSWLGD